MKKLNEVLGTNSIFTRLATHNLPWAEDTDFSNTLLDFEYLGNFSGGKYVSPAVFQNLDEDTGKLTTAAFNSLCDVVYMMYAKKWFRYWKDLTAEYNPIENYNMLEEEQTDYGRVQTLSGKDTLDMTGTDNHVHSGTDTTTHSGGYSDVHSGGSTDTHSGSVQDSGTTQAENISGFNSSSLVPSSETTNVGKNTRTFNNETMQTVYNADTVTHTYNQDQEQFVHGHTDAETRNMKDETTYGKKDTASGSDSRTLTRSGNIGVTTSQMMIESDITLWKWNFIYDVFKDIDSVFTISTY